MAVGRSAKTARERGEEEEESLQVPQEDLEASQLPDPCLYDPAINQFLAAGPSKPEVLGKDAWPEAVQIPKQMTAKEKEHVSHANKYLLMAVSS
jgi:hypothetical protein